jgi:hypothetical protein
MENLNSLNLVFADLISYIDEVIKDYGEPVRPLPHEIEELKKQIINNPSNNNPRLQKNFFLIERVEGEILFAFNVDKYLGLKDDFDLMIFLSYIDDGSYSWNYLKDYLSWAKCAYSFAKKTFKDIDTDKFAYKIRIPMRCSDGRVYWVLQEVRPLETDKDNNLISHINTYTISNLYKEKLPIGLIGEFYFDDEYQDEWNKTIAESRFSIKPFMLSATQKDILFYFYKHSNATIKSCAIELKYPVNTLKKYISDSQRKQGIIDMAKVSFPKIPISTLKDVVTFLERIGWFE